MTHKLRPYSDHKDTALPWSPRIPEHWDVQRLKYLVDERVTKGFPEEPLLTASQNHGVIRKTDYGARTVEAQKDLHLLKLVEPGDYVISLRSFQGGIEYAHARGIISPAYTILRPSPRVRRGFYESFFKSSRFVDSMTLFVTGIREGQNIDYLRLSRAYVPVPPVEEQEAIGRFIRHVDARVNRLIRAKRRLIELLNEEKRSLTQEFVTGRSLDSVDTTSSGLDAIGSIPSGWRVLRFKSLVQRIEQGKSPQAEAILADDGWWGVLKAGCANEGVFRESEHKRLPNDYQLNEDNIVRPGDVIISRASGSPRLVGSTARVKDLTYKLVLSDKTFRPVFRDPLLADFIVASMNAPYYREQVEQAISGAEGLANNLPMSRLLNFQFVVPPAAQAQSIVDDLRASLSQNERTTQTVSQEIDLIREYRTRLASDVVTGQLDVRNVDLPEIDEHLAAEFGDVDDGEDGVDEAGDVEGDEE